MSRHEEFSSDIDDDGDKVSTPNLSALFYGRGPVPNACIEIGPKGSPKNRLQIDIVVPTEEEGARFEGVIPNDTADGELLVLKTIFQSHEHIVSWLSSPDNWIPTRRQNLRLSREFRHLGHQDQPAPGMDCVSLGPGIMRNDEVAKFWDNITLTADENEAVKALQLILGDGVDRVAMVGDDRARYRTQGRRVVVKLRDHKKPVPLRSLGDGATRLFGVALALANSRNGLVLIDEAENGIHYSVHRDFWRVVLQMAHRNNVQVLATTHGWDCITGFAQAATDFGDVEGVLVRLEKENGELRAIEYTESELEIAAKQGIEVR